MCENEPSPISSNCAGVPWISDCQLRQIIFISQYLKGFCWCVIITLEAAFYGFLFFLPMGFADLPMGLADLRLQFWVAGVMLPMGSATIYGASTTPAFYGYLFAIYAVLVPPYYLVGIAGVLAVWHCSGTKGRPGSKARTGHCCYILNKDPIASLSIK